MRFNPIPDDVADIVDYDPIAGTFTWKAIIGCSRRAVGASAGSIFPGGYLFIRIRGQACAAHRVAFKIMTGRDPIFQLDHVDQNPLNNKWNNIREATALENAANRRGWGKYGKGVRKSGAKFVAVISHEYLGTFDTQDEAAAAYRSAAVSKFGPFARTM